MAAQAVLPTTLQSLRVLYQPFLGSSRARQLTSLLSTQLPCTFIPATDTSLSLVPSADIILLSRGGKPFAPVRQYPSVDTTIRSDIYAQERKHSAVGTPYLKHITRWEKAEKLLQRDINGEQPYTILQRHFSHAEIESAKFEERFRDLRRYEMVEDVDAVEQAMKIWRRYKKAQEECMIFLEKTNGMAKHHAEKAFGLGRMKMREFVIEDHRDRLDLFRLELERRYKGMAMVQFPDTKTLRPWVLVPEDPVGAWGQDCTEKIADLIELANVRFLATKKEKEMWLLQEAAKFMDEDLKDIDRFALAGVSSDKPLIEQIAGEVRREKDRMFHQDEFTIVLPGNLGTLGPDFSENPVTREDMAALQATDEELVKLGSWRVED